MEKKTLIVILNLIIIISVIIIIVSFAFMSLEIAKARNDCSNLNGNYTFKFPNHFCNNKLFFKYDDKWDFDREDMYDINLSDLG